MLSSKELAIIVHAVTKVMSKHGFLQYRGVWDVERTYAKGDCVTFRGSLWHCDKPHVGARPGLADSATTWTLAVKRGDV